METSESSATRRATRGKGIMLPRLKEHRHRAGLSLRELEELSGVANTRISLLENGRSGAQPRTLRKLAEALGVTPADLVG